MLSIVVSSDFGANDPTSLHRFINSQIHKCSHTLILKDCTSQMDGTWGSHAFYTCLVPVIIV